MQRGIPVERQYILVWEDGSVVIDWGEGELQDALTGEFRQVNLKEFCRPVLNQELDRLKAAGRVDRYDRRVVYMLALPESQRRMLD